MGLAQSHADFFHAASHVDGDRVDIFEYVRREEQALWREAPWWELREEDDDSRQVARKERASVTSARDISQATALAPSDPTTPLVRRTMPQMRASVTSLIIPSLYGLRRRCNKRSASCPR